MKTDQRLKEQQVQSPLSNITSHVFLWFYGYSGAISWPGQLFAPAFSFHANLSLMVSIPSSNSPQQNK